MPDDLLSDNSTDYGVLAGNKEHPLGRTSLGHPILVMETVVPDEYWLTHGWLFQMITYLDPKKDELYKRSFLRLGNLNVPAAVAILAVNPEGAVQFIKAYRHAIDQYVLELPSGIREEGESTQETAARELSEETGHTVNPIDIKLLGEDGIPYFLSTERTSHVAASVAPNPQNSPSPDDGEFLSDQTISMKPKELLTAMLAKKDGLVDHTSLAVIAKGLAAGLLQLHKEGTLSDEDLGAIFLHGLNYFNNEEV